MKRLLAAATLLALASAPAAADYYDGLRAYDRGDFETALREWRSAAEEGDAQSQYRLGRLYEEGRGVLQDFVQAHLFYNLAAAQGLEEAAEARDRLAERLTPEQLAEAQQLAAERLPEAPVVLAVPDLAADVQGENPPLLTAARDGDADEVRRLLEQGADADARDMAGNPALAYAAVRGHREVARSLLEGGADTDATGDRGWTPLLFAAYAGERAVAQTLLEADAEVDATGEGSLTPLMAAAVRGRDALVDLLLEAGADPALTNANGATALALAERQGHAEVAARIREAQRAALAREQQQRQGATTEMIAEAQRLLAERGLRPGPADGILGPSTRSALLAYQRQAGLVANGEVSEAVLRSLRAGDVVAPEPPRTAPEAVAFSASNRGSDTALSIDVNGTYQERQDQLVIRLREANFRIDPAYVGSVDAIELSHLKVSLASGDPTGDMTFVYQSAPYAIEQTVRAERGLTLDDVRFSFPRPRDEDLSRYFIHIQVFKEDGSFFSVNSEPLA
jgi:TPR repeat protein